MKKNRRKKPLFLSNSRWFAYATAGAATAAGSAPFVEAEIHYSGLLDVKFNDSYYHGGCCEIKSPRLMGGAKLVFQRSTSLGVVFWDFVNIKDAAVSDQIRIAYTSYQAEKLSFGQRVSSGHFQSGAGKCVLAQGYGRTSSGTGQFKEPGQGFVGFKFDVGNGVQYGWARIKMSTKGDHSFKLKDYAFADPGEPIRAGQLTSAGDMADTVTDFGSVGLLALGAPGLLA